MLETRRALSLAVCLATWTTPVAAPAATPPMGAPSGLTAVEAGALRETIYGLGATELREGDGSLLLRALEERHPELVERERRRVEAHLSGHLPTLRAAHELLEVRRRWRSLESERFAFWWEPTRRDATGLPARPPTADEVASLEAVAEAVASRLKVRVSERIPYRIDPWEATARSHPRTDLRWGVVAPDAGARGEVAELVARELGGQAGLLEPLGELLGTCHEDPACREDRLAAARAVAGEQGLVGLLEVLTVGQLGGPSDPARASALLFADVLERERPSDRLPALLSALQPGLGREEVRRVLRAVLQESPRSLERAVQRHLRALRGR